MIGQIADGKLGEEARDGAEAVDEGKLAGREADIDHIGGQQGVKGRGREPRAEAGDDAGGRYLVELDQPEMLALADLGIADPGQRQGDHRQDQSDRRHGQQQMSGRVGEVEGQRADAAGRPGDHHVDGEDAAAILVARLVVEPALDDDILPGDGIARDHAQDHPDRDLVEDQEQQRRRRGDGGEDGEAADMPDPVDDPVAGEGAQQEAAEIGRADEADQLRGLMAMGELKRDRRRQYAERRLQADDADQNFQDGPDGLEHGFP